MHKYVRSITEINLNWDLIPVEELDGFAGVVEHVLGGETLGLRDIPDLNIYKLIY